MSDQIEVTDAMVDAFAFRFYGGTMEMTGCGYSQRQVDEVREDVRIALRAALRVSYQATTFSVAIENVHLRASLRETLLIAMAYGPEGKSPPEEVAVFARAKAALGLPSTGNIGHLLSEVGQSLSAARERGTNDA